MRRACPRVTRLPRPKPRLEVHLVSARGLPKMDMLLGKCDAYVRVVVGSSEKKSKTIIRSFDRGAGETQSFRYGALNKARIIFK